MLYRRIASRLLGIAGCGSLALVLGLASALAAAATAAPNAVSDTTAYLDPIIETVIKVAAAAIGIIGTWAVARIAQHFGLQVSAQQQSAFETALTKLVQSGASTLDHNVIVANGWDSINVKNATLAAAVNDAAEKFPDALKGVGLDPTDPAFEAKLRAALDRIYPSAMVPVVNSPATPLTPAPAPVVVVQAAPAV